MKKMSLKSVSPIILAGVLFIVAAGLYVMTKNNQKQELASILGADLAYREGGVQYKSGSSDWQVATAGQDLKQGDSIKIVGVGKAILALDDGSAVRLNSDSQIILEKLTANEIIIRNESGEVYTRVVPMNRTFMVVTASASYKSLGTAYTTINKADSKGVRVFESQVKLIEGSNEVTVPEGKQYFLEKKELASILASDLSADDFISWNKTQDEQVGEYKEKLGTLTSLLSTPTPTPVPTPEITPTPTPIPATKVPEATATPTSSLTLTGKANDNGVALTWKTSNLSASKGYKLVKSTSANPVYPGDSYIYLSNEASKSYTWEIQDGKTYHFRVCVYTGEGCSKYSNDITVSAPNKKQSEENSNDDSSVSSIIASGSGKDITWDVIGESEMGFKVVWSKSSGPTYPNRETDRYNYLSSYSARSTTLTAFDGAGTYYVRVCEYLGGSCGTYSNQIEVEL